MMNKQCGQNLAEILIALSILSFTTAIAAPAMEQVIRSNERTHALNQMLAALGYARSEAVFGRHETLLCAGSNSCLNTPNWNHELLVFHDINANTQRDQGEKLLRREQVPKGYSWHWSSFRKLDHIVFQADGTARAANGTLTLCWEGQPQYQVIINVAGRARHQNPSANAQCR